MIEDFLFYRLPGRTDRNNTNNKGTSDGKVFYLIGP